MDVAFLQVERNRSVSITFFFMYEIYLVEECNNNVKQKLKVLFLGLPLPWKGSDLATFCKVRSKNFMLKLQAKCCFFMNYFSFDTYNLQGDRCPDFSYMPLRVKMSFHQLIGCPWLLVFHCGM